MARLIASLWVATVALAGQPRFVQRPRAARDGKSITVTFALSAPTDVEVAILDAKGTVVRHLAAGALGGKKPPPPPLGPGLSQRIEWDGRNDDGGPAGDLAALSVRVRAGMGVSLDRIVGGDPYAFYSKEMGQGDHAAWRITGLEAKPDGSVYVIGNANNYGPPALRQYTATGVYQRTIYPPPAGKPREAMAGWGIHVRADGTYSPKYNDLCSPALSTTLIGGNRGRCACLLPTPANDSLTLRSRDYDLMTIGTDGTLRDYRPVPVVADPPIPKRGLLGPFFSACAPDGRSMYVSGPFSCDHRYGSVLAVHTTGFWRDGQVWQVDLATRKARVFFALDEGAVIGDMKARGSSPIAHTRATPYAAFHGVAVDADHHVLVCDRQNQRIVALDRDGQRIRDIPVLHPDAIALHPTSKALYVTPRVGSYHRHGELRLLKFNDWTKDGEPALTVPLCRVGKYRQSSLLAVCVTKSDVLVWVAYTTLPVRVYRDKGAELELIKDFYEAGPQRALDLQHMLADPATGDVYVADGFGSCFRVADWERPRFERCLAGAGKPLRLASIAMDRRGRYLYGRPPFGAVARYSKDGPCFVPAPVGETGSHILTPKICSDWRIGLGFGNRGFAVAPDGSLATLGAVQAGGDDYAGYLNYFRRDDAATPWQPLLFRSFGKARAGGLRFDLQGNLYVGKYDGQVGEPPSGFEKDRSFARSMGRIYKFAPTGRPGSGDLFPTEPAAAAKIYDVHYGSIGPVFSRTPRFGVDGYGRIYYPTSLVPRVSVIDNEGNRILSFGTYGNRDSTGGLTGDLVPTSDIPLAWPNSVDATDDYIYIADVVNIRLLRLRKTFRLDSTRP